MLLNELTERATARPLATGYAAEADHIPEHAWYDALQRFDDANIYQTWAYGMVTAGARNTSHVVVSRDNDIVGIAQARLVRIPLTRVGIAYILWGPLWRRRGEEANPEVLRQVLRALRNEYVCRRGLSLRLSLRLVDNGSKELTTILASEGFAPSGQGVSRTVLMDLKRPLTDLRAGMSAHWKRELKAGDRNQLEIMEGSGGDLLSEFISAYREMVARKQFREPNDIEHFRAIQKMLPEQLKMRILLSRAGGTVCAGAICSALGDTAVYLFGATSNAGMRSRGSYVLQWRLIEELQREGISTYDLNGINPITNPGTFKFKTDLVGNNGADVCFLGAFDAHGSRLSRLCIQGWNALRNSRRRGMFRGRWSPVLNTAGGQTR
jgi:hypothetical protein